jgi:hypothetical protein
VAVEEAYELAYREAVRALDHQLATLTELRSRAGMLLAVASIAVSLLGREASHATRPLAWAAVACFSLLGVCVLAIVWPNAHSDFDLDPQVLIDAGLSGDRPFAADWTLELIGHMARQQRANGRQLARIVRVFRVGACLLAIQIVLTTVAGATIF